MCMCVHTHTHSKKSPVHTHTHTHIHTHTHTLAKTMYYMCMHVYSVFRAIPWATRAPKSWCRGSRTSTARPAPTATTATADSNTADTLSMDSSASSNIDPVTASRRYLLQELDLTDTGLGDKGAEHVAQLLANNVYVESLGLSHNSHISAQDGWSRIGEALAKNRCLRTLSLDGNRLGDEGVEHLAHGLRTNRALRSLTLEDAGVSVEGGKRLMEMLKRNTTLLELTLLPGNSIPDELAEDIKKYIALNRAPYDNFGV